MEVAHRSSKHDNIAEGESAPQYQFLHARTGLSSTHHSRGRCQGLTLPEQSALRGPSYFGLTGKAPGEGDISSVKASGVSSPVRWARFGLGLNWRFSFFVFFVFFVVRFCFFLAIGCDTYRFVI